MPNSIPARIVTDVYDLATLTDFGDRLVIERWTSDRLVIGCVLTLLFAVLARILRGVTTGGALAGAVSCFVLYLGGGPGAFAALVTVFGLAWMTTRLGYQRKLKLGTAEKREGRNASQVLANLGIATACAALHILSPDNTVFLLALTAALSEAAADTVSSEVGQAFSEKARLITDWTSVPAGTNGAVSLTGTWAGIAAAAIVTSVCVFSGLLPWRWLAISTCPSTFRLRN